MVRATLKNAGKSLGRVDPKQLAMGKKIEREHTNDPATAEQIARDHLAEFPGYYSALAEMEDELKENKGRLRTKRKKREHEDDEEDD